MQKKRSPQYYSRVTSSFILAGVLSVISESSGMSFYWKPQKCVFVSFSLLGICYVLIWFCMCYLTTYPSICLFDFTVFLMYDSLHFMAVAFPLLFQLPSKGVVTPFNFLNCCTVNETRVRGRQPATTLPKLLRMADCSSRGLLGVGKSHPKSHLIPLQETFIPG